MKTAVTFILLIGFFRASAQKPDTLTVEKIMRDPKWIGVSPSNVHWDNNSEKLYFDWNPEKSDRSILYSVTPTAITPVKVSIGSQRSLPAEQGEWNTKHTMKLYAKNGDIYLYSLKTGGIRQLTCTTVRERNLSFSGDESKAIFEEGDNLYSLNLSGGELAQLTDFVHKAAPAPTAGRRGRPGGTPREQNADNDQDRWLKAQQLELFDIIKVKDKDRRLDSIERKELEGKKIKEIVIGDHLVNFLVLSPDGRYITYQLEKKPEGVKNAMVPDYVTASGFTEDIPNRTKVGAPQAIYDSFIFDTQKDTVYKVNTTAIPGIKDLPAYLKDYPKELEHYTKLNEDRKVIIGETRWSANGKNAVVEILSQDNKDRWLMKLDPSDGSMKLLDREHNDAWIGGPGQINLGWTDDTHIYFESEASGYAHIYLIDVLNGAKQQLTSGKWEVQTLQLSKDKKTFYFTANMDHPGVTDFYRMPVEGGLPVKLTSVKGMKEITLSPDERWLAIRYSYTNNPWELYIQLNKAGAKAVQVTNSTSAEFKSYPWRAPEIITFKNRYGSDVYAHLYLPKNPDPAKPAVIFVHGAGYLQNVEYGWSYYFREYMFNNMLTDKGYTVMDMDYSGSAGYGRDWRTAIYRHMGGKDLTDEADGVKMLIEKYGVNRTHVGLYGGSYGGFITLMAMFTEPEVFSSGAAIRSVTDWAHYNHEYTDEILNEPFNDENAYRQSSPIYFADGLKGNLLMLHGMVDQNVNYQDIIRLIQRLIELHKDNWELASYPVEDHAFEQPSSWTDEYKRIFKLFEQTLRK